MRGLGLARPAKLLKELARLSASRWASRADAPLSDCPACPPPVCLTALHHLRLVCVCVLPTINPKALGLQPPGAPRPRRGGAARGRGGARAGSGGALYTRNPNPTGGHTAPYTLHPTPCTLHPAPLDPTPYTLHPTPCILHPTPYTLHSCALTSKPRGQGGGGGSESDVALVERGVFRLRSEP